MKRVQGTTNTMWDRVQALIIELERDGRKRHKLRALLRDLQRIRYRRFSEPLGLEEVRFQELYDDLLERVGRSKTSLGGREGAQDRWTIAKGSGHSDPTVELTRWSLQLEAVNGDLAELLERHPL